MHCAYMIMMLFLGVFFVRYCLSVILLSNLPGKKRKHTGIHNGYYGKLILKNEMDILY